MDSWQSHLNTLSNKYHALVSGINDSQITRLTLERDLCTNEHQRLSLRLPKSPTSNYELQIQFSALIRKKAEVFPATDKYLLALSSSKTGGVFSQMPQRVTCQACGRVLYEGPELKPPEEILHEHEGKCPSCGKKLSLIPIDINVKPNR